MIQRIYDEMWERYRVATINDQYTLDSLIYAPDDTRRGITALAYLDSNSKHICEAFSQFQDAVRTLEPHQYFHPRTEMHLTVLAIISCIEDFTLSDINAQEYIDIFNDVTQKAPPIEVEFRGITASADCIVAQGFPVGTGLAELRSRLREAYKQSGLRNSIDTRYKLVTAHSTLVRFCAPIKQRNALYKLCEQYRDYSFGRLVVDDLALVFNNWYQHLSATKFLSTHSL